MSATTFGDALRVARRRHGVSQDKLGRLANFDQSYIYRLEANDRMPTSDAVDRLANAMGATDSEWAWLRHCAGFVANRDVTAHDPLAIDLDAALCRLRGSETETALRTAVGLILAGVEGRRCARHE